MSPELKWMIAIYVVAFIFINIGVIIRMNTDYAEGILDGGDKIFFGLKNIWGYVHLALYTFLGYKCGIDLFPIAFVVSILWDCYESLLQDITNDIIRSDGAMDTFIEYGWLWVRYISST